jgi:hypothetical protein
MRKSRYRHRVFGDKRASLLLYLILITSMLISCRERMAEPAAHTATPVPPLVSPTITQEQVSLTSSATITQTSRPTITPLLTRTPYPPTKTPIPCPPFSIDTELPEPDIQENYIGRHYDVHKLPEGLQWESSSIIRDYSGQLEYSFTRLTWDNNRQMFWLKDNICYDSQGKSFSEIIDVIASPPLEGNETITSWCFEESELIPDIIAIGTYDLSQPIIEIGEREPGKPYVGWQYNHIVFAFQIDMERDKFIELDTTDLLCLEYQYGRGSSES